MWVIAETKDLPTNFIKIVVTNDQGRFLLPELPNANYSVWVRGYGLVDSKPQPLKPGPTQVTLRVDPGEDAAGSGEGLSRQLLALDAGATGGLSEFPGTGPQGNGLGTGMLSQNHWINSLKSDCNFCHQLGQQADAQRRSRAQGEARAEDACRSVGVEARHRRSRHVDVRRARQPGSDAIAEGVLRLDRAHREG